MRSVAIAQPEAGVQKPLMQNRPGQQLQPSVSGVQRSPSRMQQVPEEWQSQRSSGQLPQLRPQPSSPHASSPSQSGVHGTQWPLSHFLPTGQSGQTRGWPQESVEGPHDSSEAHDRGVQVPGSPHTLGVPPPPHSRGGVQSGHTVVPPQVSSMSPHESGTSSHVTGLHAQRLSPVLAWQNLSSRQAKPDGQSFVIRQRTVHALNSGA